MKSNQRFIDKATKKAERGHDALKLDYIQSNSQLKWLREIPLHDGRFSTANHIRIPDLIHMGIILEHDSIKAHGELGYENQRTVNRNEDYFKTKRPYLIINEGLAKHLGLDQAKLSDYLYYHTLSQINAGVWT